MMKKLQKHRLALLLGVLVALVFFYFGVNTWMESQQKKVAPPPVVRTKPPVQIKREAQPVKPVKPQPPQRPQPQMATKPVPKPQPKPRVERPKLQPKPVAQVKKPQETPKPKTTVAQTPKKETPSVKTAKPTKPVAKKATAPKKETKSVKKPTKEKTSGKVRDFVVQIGAFKVKVNADRRLNIAKKEGLDAFVIEEEGLYKVRVRVKADSLISALRKVRGSFKNAFVVLR